MGNWFAVGRPTRGDFGVKADEYVERLPTGCASDAQVDPKQFYCWRFGINHTSAR